MVFGWGRTFLPLWTLSSEHLSLEEFKRRVVHRRNHSFATHRYGSCPLCQEHGKQLEMKEVVVLDQTATENWLHLTIVGCARKPVVDI